MPAGATPRRLVRRAVYGPLATGRCRFMHEGTSEPPTRGSLVADDRRLRDLAARHGVHADPDVVKWGNGALAAHDLSALRSRRSAGEPINPEALMRYHKDIPGHRGPDLRHVVRNGLARSNTQSSGVVTTKQSQR